MEEWVIIEEAPNYYISNYGRVFSTKRNIFLKPGFGGQGKYPFVVLSNNGPQFNRYIHILVATAFVDGWFEGAEVNHKDGVKTNNIWWNLEWVTQLKNKQHAVLLGLYGKKVRIIETGEVFQSLSYCAKAIGGTPQNISHCLSGRRNSHCGYTFELIY